MAYPFFHRAHIEDHQDLEEDINGRWNRNGLYLVVKIDLTPRRNEMVTITDRVVTNRDESTSMRTTAPLLVLAMCCWLASFETNPHSE
jgi:hypothetical protein